VRRALLFVAAALAFAAPAGAQASTIVYVCGKDLCSANERGERTARLTNDGGRAGGYTRPTISRDGKRVAFKRGDPGRVFTAKLGKRGLTARRRIGPAPGGPPDATQFDAAVSPDGRHVAWVELRINVVFDTIDYRRYVARIDGSRSEQVAASGGRPFVAWASNAITLREGLTVETDEQQTDESPDSGLCTASPGSAQNGTCRGPGARQFAFDSTGRHLRHPDVFGHRLVATAYPYTGGPDNAIQRPGSIALFDTRSALLVRNLTEATTDTSPGFSPDGRRVAFERRGAVYTVPVAGGAAQRLLRRAAEPTWSR